MLTVLTIAFYIAFSLVLLPYGYNTLVLMVGASKYQLSEPEPLDEYPLVTVQLPVYNEVNVVARLIDSVCALEWPRNRLEIQVLDDSDDETFGLVHERVDYYRSKVVFINVLRRDSRAGYKAGALTLVVLGYGISAICAVSLVEGLFMEGGEFMRVPKNGAQTQDRVPKLFASLEPTSMALCTLA